MWAEVIIVVGGLLVLLAMFLVVRVNRKDAKDIWHEPEDEHLQALLDRERRG
jgi:hypothetical protein